MGLRIGIVCPYSLATPGGVQNHVRELAEELIRRGHEVSVLAPVDPHEPPPPYVTSCGRAVGLRYNGSTARVTFGPRTVWRTRQWQRRGRFDVVHVHEPTTPSAALLTLATGRGPYVATFHTWQTRSRAMRMASVLLRPALEKIDARVAVSEVARQMMVQHLGADAVVIPNGVHVGRYAVEEAPGTGADRAAASRARRASRVCFLGRLDEPRKGLRVLLAALPDLVREVPDVELVLAGSGRLGPQLAGLPAVVRDHVRVVGQIDDDAKIELLRRSRVLVAPHLGRESFGIVLAEAMAAGAVVVASDLPAFRQLLTEPDESAPDTVSHTASDLESDADDRVAGLLVRPGDPVALAEAVAGVIRSPATADGFVAAGAARAQRFDWPGVVDDVSAVYDLVAG